MSDTFHGCLTVVTKGGYGRRIMSDLLAGYASGRAWDELFEAPSVPRPPYQDVHASIGRLSADDLTARADRLGRILRDLGLTFDFAGEERPFRQRRGQGRSGPSVQHVSPPR